MPENFTVTERANHSDTGSDPVEEPQDPNIGPGTGEEKALLDELLRDRAQPSPHQPVSAGVGPQTRVGTLVEWSSGQAPTVEFPGNQRGPLAARSIIPLDPTTIAEAIASARGVLLTFEDGRPDAPIITGLIRDFSKVTNDPELAPQVWDDDNDPTQSEHDADSNLESVEARIDGRRVELEAADEIVLRCGQASIVLRRNGRVVIRGTYVETRSRGVNRVKGGSVEIN